MLVRVEITKIHGYVMYHCPYRKMVNREDSKLKSCQIDRDNIVFFVCINRHVFEYGSLTLDL
jgi:hypothetical protein